MLHFTVVFHVCAATVAAFVASFAAFADPCGVFFLFCYWLVPFVLLFVQLAAACAASVVGVFLFFAALFVSACIVVSVALLFLFCVLLLFFFFRTTGNEMSVKSVPTAKVPSLRAATQSGHHAQPHALKARLHPHWSNKEAVNALAVEHASTAPHLRRWAALTLFLQNERGSLGRGIGQRSQIHFTGRPHPQRGPPIEPALPLPTIRDKFFLFGDVPPPRPLRRGLQHVTWRNRRVAKATPTSCRSPVVPRATK